MWQRRFVLNRSAGPDDKKKARLITRLTRRSRQAVPQMTSDYIGSHLVQSHYGHTD